jgi:transcriptional regulator with XRE-family HTH domain
VRPEQTAILETLRKILKNRKLTYAQVAARLGVSEQTVKRVFNGDDCPVSRLLEICDVAGVKLADVMQLTENEGEAFFELTPEQEQHFVDYPSEYRFFIQLLEGKDADAIKAEHGLSDRAVFKYLRQIEALGLCDVLPGNRYTLKVRGDHSFLRNGPLAKKHGTDLMTEMFAFLSEEKNQSDRTTWTSTSTRISVDTLRDMKEEMKDLARRYRKIAARESELLPKDQTVDTTWVLAIASPFQSLSHTKIVNPYS